MLHAPGSDERKQATILFADICGSTAQILQFDVEEARDFLAPAVELMRGAAQLYGGQVYRVEGDAILAVFGAPLGQEDQALRACLTAVELQRRAATAAQGSSPLLLRVGIHSGEVISWRESGSGVDRIDGSNVHLAKRLQEASPPGRITISAATRRLVSHELDAVSLGQQSVRDFGAVELFELSQESSRPRPDEVARRRLSGRLVGRAEALSALESVARRVREGRMCIAGLRGEAGIGKSRIAAEVVLRLHESGFGSAWVSARSYATHVPYALAAEFARVLIGLPDRGTPGWDEAVAALVEGWPADQGKLLSAVADLLGASPLDPDWSQRTPSQRQRDVNEAVAWLIAQRVKDAPLVVVVDDIFLADRESLRLMEALEQPLGAAPVLLCMTYRQDFVHRWGSSAAFTEHWIGPLEDAPMRDLAQRLLGTDTSLAELSEELLERADGNPFFLEQMAQSLVDDGTLQGSPGAYRSAGAAGELRVPGSIAAVIGARVDRLPGAGKAALEAAAVVGGHINGHVVGAMLGLAEPQASELLDSALSAGLLAYARDEATLGGVAPSRAGARLEFSHGLVQEAVAGALTRPRRRALHRAAFEALTACLGARSADHAAELAHHAYLGEAWPAAAQAALQAISRSISRSANRDALRVFALGLDAARRIAETPLSLRSELALRLEALGAQLPLGMQDDLLANLERAERITQEIGDARRQAAVQVQLAVVQWSHGRYREGLLSANRAAQAAQVAGSRSLQMAASQAAMLLHHGLGHYPQVEEQARAIERDFAPELAAGRVLPGWAVMASVNSKVFLADVLARAGRMEEAQRCCDAAYAEAGRHEHAFSRSLIDFVQSELWVAQGRLALARACLEEARARCRSQDVLAMIAPIVALWAGCIALEGRAQEAVQTLQGALSSKLDQSGGKYNAFYFPKYLALALGAAGRAQEARECASQAVTAARSLEQTGFEAEGLLVLAELEAAAGLADDARAHFTDGAERAGRCGAWSVQRRCEQGLAMLGADLFSTRAQPQDQDLPAGAGVQARP
ncbi:MAG: ATP-binding protein [Rubrivivax sp.]